MTKINFIETYAYKMSKELVNEKEEIQRKNNKITHRNT